MPPERHAHELAAGNSAIDLASDVLPTPGGPRKRIGSFTSGFSLRTARYSSTRSFTFSRPEWSASSTSCDPHLRSIASSVRLAQGSAMIQSRYVRETVYSAAATGILESRSSSRRASFLTPSGRPAASSFSRSSSISLACSSPSPSSFWIAFICSRRKYSRWFLPTSDCTCDWILDPSSRTSSSLMSRRLSESIRARISSVSSTSCLTAVPIVVRLEAMKSASLPGSVMLPASAWRSLLQPQDVMSRHRGAKQPRRWGLLGVISLLSPAYLLSVERWPFHAGPPDH